MDVWNKEVTNWESRDKKQGGTKRIKPREMGNWGRAKPLLLTSGLTILFSVPSFLSII